MSAARGMAEWTANGVDYTINDPNIAEEFDPTKAYHVHDHVYYQGNLYVFIAEHAAGAWNTSHVLLHKVGEELVNLWSANETEATLRVAADNDLKSALYAFDDYFENGLFEIYPRMNVGQAIRTTNGTVWNSGASTFASTDFIPVPSGATRLKSNAVAGGSQIGLAFYSEPNESSFISGSGVGGYSSFDVAINPTYKYFRFTANKSDGDFSSIYLQATEERGGLDGLAEDIGDVSAVVESLDIFGTIWSDGSIGTNGAENTNADYSKSTYIPVRSIRRISATIPINVNYYTQTKSHVCLIQYNANSVIVPPAADEYGYVRIWYTKANSTDIKTELTMEFGDILRPRCGYGLIQQNTGNVSSQAGYIYTDYLPIDFIKSITLVGNKHIHYYGAGKNWLAYGGAVSDDTFNLDKVATIRDDAVFVRLWCAGSDIKTFLDGLTIVEKVNTSEDLDALNFTWSDGLIGSNGVLAINHSYAISSFIPVGIIKEIVSTISINIVYFNKDKTFLFYKNYSANTPFVLPSTDTFGFVRIWYTKANSTNIDSELKITWGEPDFPKCGHGFINNSTGNISINTNYTVTDFIPVGLIEYVVSDREIHCDFYDVEKSHLSVISYPAGKALIPHDRSYAYVRIWAGGSDIKDFTDNLEIKFGAAKEAKIAMPAKEYMLSGIEYDLFYDNIVDLKKANICRIEGEARGTESAKLLNTQKCCIIEHPESITNSEMYVCLYDAEERGRLVAQKVDIVVSNKNTDTGNLYAMVVGDSYTDGDGTQSWIDHILAANLCPNIHFVGLCKNPVHNGQYHEGRGSWTMAMYAEPATGTGLEGRVYAGFWQPNDSYKYWGDIRFWANVKSGQAALSDFDGSKFDANGYLLNPTTNDIMYNGTNYIKWNGSQWATVAKTDYTWGFDFGKYITMWNITAPSICAVMLGVNDFREAIFTNAGWASFKVNLNNFITSYHAAVPTGKFVAVIHCTDMGRDWNINTSMRTSAEYQNYVLWQYRKNMIADFDGRESEGVYLCDAGIMVDGEYGYEITERKPFSTYAGNLRIKLQTTNPHPTLAYPAMSLPFAAIIQYLRAQ